jgi:hypothetical protein
MRFRVRAHVRLVRILPLALGVVVLAGTLTAQAQTPAATSPGAPPAATPPAASSAAKTPAPARTPRATPPAAATPTASQAAAARELFKALKLEESIPNTTAAMVDSEVSHNPGLAPYRDIMLAWLRKYMTFDAMLPELTRVYCDTYTEGEMKALAMFYSSPLGQKSISKTPELMSKTAGIGAKISQPHSSELSTQLSARRDELKAQAGAKTPGTGGTPPPAAAAPPPSLPTPK